MNTEFCQIALPFVAKMNEDAKIRREEEHVTYWKNIFGWNGPKVGKKCSINAVIADTPEGGKLYCYTEDCRILEELPDKKWLAEIEMKDHDGEPWFKNGQKVILGITDIWVPSFIIRRRNRTESKGGVLR